MTFIWLYIKKMFFFSIFYFDPRVIWGGFRHPKSIFRYLKIEMLWKNDFFFLTPKSIFSIKKKEPEPNWTGTRPNRNRTEPEPTETEPNRTEPWDSCTLLICIFVPPYVHTSVPSYLFRDLKSCPGERPPPSPGPLKINIFGSRTALEIPGTSPERCGNAQSFLNICSIDF